MLAGPYTKMQLARLNDIWRASAFLDNWHFDHENFHDDAFARAFSTGRGGGKVGASGGPSQLVVAGVDGALSIADTIAVPGNADVLFGNVNIDVQTGQIFSIDGPNVSIIGRGKNRTVFTYAANAAVDASRSIRGVGVDGFLLRGFTIDGNEANQTATAGLTQTVRISNTERGEIEDCQFKNLIHKCVNVINSNRVNVHDCVFDISRNFSPAINYEPGIDGCTGWRIYRNFIDGLGVNASLISISGNSATAGHSDFWLRDNEILVGDTTTGSLGIEIQSQQAAIPIREGHVIDNKIRKVTTVNTNGSGMSVVGGQIYDMVLRGNHLRNLHGIAVEIGGLDCHDYEVTENTLLACSGIGVFANSGSSVVEAISITKNHIRDSIQDSILLRADSGDTLRDCLVAHNIIRDTISGKAAIVLWGNAGATYQDVSVIGNKVRGTNAAAGNTGAIQNFQDINDCLISENFITDWLDDGIRLSVDSSNCSGSDNKFRNVTTPIDDTGTANTVT